MQLRVVSLAVAAIFVIAADPAPAQNMSGRVVTKKILAACKLQAKEQKLTYMKRRKFVRECVKR